MEQDLAQLLQHVSREQLILLLQELARRHSALDAEIETILATLSSRPTEQEPLLDDEFTADALVFRRPLSPQAATAPFNQDAYQHRLAGYALRLRRGARPQEIFDDLVTLLQEAEARVNQYNYQQALYIYALVIDTRLALENTTLVHIFDRALDEFMPVLVTLLSDAGSLITSENDPDLDREYAHNNVDTLPISGELSNELSAILPADKRQLWLERLFSLWLKRLDIYYTEENLPEAMLEIAWSDDVPLLRSLIEKELGHQPASVHSNIVDFSLQSRTRTLEKFLRELPHT